VFEERDERFRAGITRAVEAGLRDGSIRANVAPAALAVAIAGQLRGIALQFVFAPEAIELEAVRDEVVAWTDRALRP
jgi:hypothetical protein